MYGSKNRKPYNKHHAKPFSPGGAAAKGKYLGQTKKVAGNKKGNREGC